MTKRGPPLFVKKLVFFRKNEKKKRNREVIREVIREVKEK